MNPCVTSCQSCFFCHVILQQEYFSYMLRHVSFTIHHSAVHQGGAVPDCALTARNQCSCYNFIIAPSKILVLCHRILMGDMVVSVVECSTEPSTSPCKLSLWSFSLLFLLSPKSALSLIEVWASIEECSSSSSSKELRKNLCRQWATQMMPSWPGCPFIIFSSVRMIVTDHQWNITM